MLDFLHDSIHLVSIVPDGPLSARWFGSDHAAALDWAMAQNATGANLYFTVNQTHPGVAIKPSKADIQAVRFAHVDIDPPESGEWDRDGALMALLAQNPSVVIDSGNGWQGLWRLTESDAGIEETNRGLAHALGADPRVHNIDRLFRVPGTTNYPNATKRAKGRTPQPSSLILSEPHAFTPEVLRAHYPAPARAPSTRSIPDMYDGPYEPDFDPPIPSDRLRDMLWADVGPGARSEHAAALAHLMGREGYTFPQILGTLLNPQWPWAGTIQDQADPERQARRKLMGVTVWPRGSDMFPDDEPRADAVVEPPSITRARTFGYGTRDGGIMHIDQQFDHFKGCVYVSSLDRVLMPDGSELNQSRFDNIMGGYSFIFTEDGKVTKSAWEALLKNQRYSAPWAHHVCFRPELPPLTMTEDGTWVLVNTFIPIDTPTLDADPSPFLNHMASLFPVERDRAIVINFMASVIQNPGFKAQWWPVIQGAKGNGKTLLLNIMAFAVGEQYSHLPNTGKMTRSGINFNGWMKGKLFLGIDEIYSANRRDFLEEFKPYVTNRRLPIESKGIDEYTGDNRANGIMLTNHQDGVPIDKDERRYAPLFTAQQTAEDCIRDGLTSSYFSNLWAWFRGEGKYAAHGADYGFRIVNLYLRTFVTDPLLDPAQLATRAPKTSSTEQAILAGRGRVEQEILEAIDQGQPGFAGGWISSIMLYKLFDAKRISFPRNKCRDMLKHLGYVPHPGLSDGRTNDMVQPDSGKPRLFVLTDHPSLNYGSGLEIAKKYTEDQITQILGA